MTKEVHSFHF